MKREKTFFGKRLKKILLEKDITQQNLADKLKIGKTVISRWITGGRNPSLSSVKNIAEVLNVPLDYFIDNDKNSNTQNSTENIDNKLIIDLIRKENKILEERIKKLETEIKKIRGLEE